jgi:hypothetical protein
MAKTSSGGFQYAGRTAEEVNRRAKESSRSYDSIFEDGFVVYKPKEGENIIRILPPTWLSFDDNGNMLKDEAFEKWGAYWEISVYVHNNIGPDRSTFLCLAEMKDEPCPVCEARLDAADEEERFALSPNRRALCWLIDRNDEKAGPQLWAMPHKKVFKPICARSTDRKTGGVILVDNPEEGYDVFFNVEHAGKKNADYTAVDFDRDPTPIHDDERIQAKWLKYIKENPLPEILNFQDHDYMLKVLSGRISKKEQDEEVEETTTTTRRPRRGASEETEEPEGRLPRSRRRATEETDPTGDEPEEGSAERRGTRGERGRDAEEEAETRPSGRRAGARSGREPEEETEADDLPPRRGRRAAAEEPEEEILEESRTARKGLERLRPGARKEEPTAPPPPSRSSRPR